MAIVEWRGRICEIYGMDVAKTDRFDWRKADLSGVDSVVFYGYSAGVQDGVCDIHKKFSDIMPIQYDHDLGIRRKKSVLVGYRVSDWYADFSPWSADDPCGRHFFAGNGRATLDWLLGAIEELKHIFDKNKSNMDEHFYLHNKKIKISLAGYSLAGLFSLWAYYEARRMGNIHIDGVASCSGSLWYPGWKEYILAEYERLNMDKSLPMDCQPETDVFLSLGEGEEHTRNAVMARVGDVTRLLDSLLSCDPYIFRHNLQMNRGGHFDDANLRVALAMEWLLENEK